MILSDFFIIQISLHCMALWQIMQFHLFDLGQYPYNVHIYFFMDIWVGTCHISGRLRHRIMLLSIHGCLRVMTGVYNNWSFSDLYCSNRADGVVGQVPGSSVGKHGKAQIPFASKTHQSRKFFQVVLQPAAQLSLPNNQTKLPGYKTSICQIGCSINEKS